MRKLDWELYIENYLDGIKKYLTKEDKSKLNLYRKKYHRYQRIKMCFYKKTFKLTYIINSRLKLIRSIAIWFSSLSIIYLVFIKSTSIRNILRLLVILIFKKLNIKFLRKLFF